MNCQIDYQMLVTLLVTGIIMVVFFYVTSAILYNEIPTDEKCQSIYGYSMQEKVYAEKYFCERNETGWHLNKTKFREELSKTEGWVT